MRRTVRPAAAHWRAAWVASPPWARALWVLVVGMAAVSSAWLGLVLGDPGSLLTAAAVSYIIVPIGAAVLLVSSGLRRSGPGSMAWVVIGAGVALWAMGETIWQYYIAYLGVEVPYPGMADVFYVAAYPVMFIGVVMLPHVRGRRWERVRLGLDVVAGTVAVSALFWTFFLADVISLDSSAGRLENLVNLGYPVGDLMLLVATMILATRRSQLQFDGRILLLAAGMALTALADVLYVYQIAAGTYSEVGPLDTLWLASYGLFAVAALLVAGPTRLRDQADRPGRVWPLIAPYSAIIVLFVLTLGELGGQATTLQIATALVGILIIVRQGVAIRETRDIVEKQRNDLVASISHELRTPLTAMKGFIEILDDQPDLDRTERLEMISIVNTQTNHLARIVGDLVEVARDKLESTRLSYHTVHVADLVDSAIGMLTGTSPVGITSHVPPDLTIDGDTDRLRQVLVNYLTNAERYGHGIVEVHARGVDSGLTLIEVHDNGPGIPKKFEVTIWDRFERGAHTYLSKVQGSGLGLAIARQLVAAHHGKTGHRQSERLGGACFWLMVPMRSSVAIPAAAEHSTVGG